MTHFMAPTPRRIRLFLEELESRRLLSASSLGSFIAHPLATATPLGNINPLTSSSSFAVYTPAQIRHAYGFDQLPYDGTGQTIAIVDAYDSPTVYSDLVAFDRTFGLPNPPLFVKAMPEGQPPVNASWAGEIALDVEWAHAIAPKANILLVEAKSSSGSDLLNAVNWARYQPGVVAVSMSWGTSEFYNEQSLDSYFTTPVGHVGGSGLQGGVTFIASAGDSGAWYGPEWPSVSANVLAVGGTSLTLGAGSAYAAETAWSGSGGGVSQYETRPGYQQGFVGGARRDAPDVSYDASPNTGFYVYDTTPMNGYSGWYSFGGTSAGSPQWAGLLALVDQGRALAGHGSLGNAQASIYTLSSADFHDVTSGSNGYSATSGYDLVTGRGSPIANRIVADLIHVGTTSNAVVATTGQATLIAGRNNTSNPGQLPVTGELFASVEIGVNKRSDGSHDVTYSMDTAAPMLAIVTNESAWSSAFHHRSGLETAAFAGDLSANSVPFDLAAVFSLPATDESGNTSGFALAGDSPESATDNR